MNFRARLSMLCLEARDNPSGPDVIAPFTPPPADTTVTAPPANDNTVIDIATAVAGGTTTTDPNALQDTNPIYGTPQIP